MPGEGGVVRLAEALVGGRSEVPVSGRRLFLGEDADDLAAKANVS